MPKKRVKTLAEEQEEMRARRAIEGLPPSKKMALTGERKGKLHSPYTDKQKLLALKTYVVTGSVVTSAQESGIQYMYLRTLVQTQWWKDSIKEIRKEEEDILDTEISGLITSSVDILKDRLKNGDWMWNSKENKFMRKAIPMREALKATTSLIDQRNVMRGKPTRIVENVSMTERLNKLALEFEKFNDARTIQHKAKKDAEQPLIEDVVFTEEVVDGQSTPEL